MDTISNIKKLQSVFYTVRKIYNAKYEKSPFVNYLIHNYGGKPLTGCEIGVKYGENAEQMCFHLKIKELYLIDPYVFNDDFKIPKNKNKELMGWVDLFDQVDYDNAYIFAKKRLRRCPVVFIKDKSLNVVDDFEDGFFDFMYFDGNLKLIKDDIKCYYPKVREGGLFGGHDFDAEKTYVTEAVTDFVKEYNLLLRGGNNEWWVKKGEQNNLDDSRKWGCNTTG